MRWPGSVSIVVRWFATVPIFTSTAACDSVADLWPNDELAPGTTSLPCRSTRVAPTITVDEGGAGPIEIAETDALADVIALSSQGSGADFVSAINIVHGVGALSFGCERAPAAIYFRVPNGEVQWFYGIAVRPDRLYHFGLVCSAGELTYLYYEGTDGTTWTYEPAQGTCSEGSASVSSRVAFPAASIALPKLVTGFTIDGLLLSLDARGTGTLTRDSVEHQLAVFSHVSCSDDCDELDWHDLHALVWEPGKDNASFAILELLGGEPIELDQTVTLPTFLPELGNNSFEAAFTTP